MHTHAQTMHKCMGARLHIFCTHAFTDLHENWFGSLYLKISPHLADSIPIDKMSQNKKVFRHMTDIFVFRNYLGPSISDIFQTSWTHFRHLPPDGLRNFQAPSKHLPDIFQTPLRAPQETFKFTDIWPIKWQRLKSSVHYEPRNCKMRSVKSFVGHPVVA